MVVFQALTWEARDTDEEHLISIFGKTEDGKSVCVTTSFDPYFFVKLPRGTTQQDVKILFNELNRLRENCVTSYSLTKQKDVWGFQNNEEFNYMHLNFKTLEARRRINSLFMYNNDFKKYHVYESNLDPVLRLSTELGFNLLGGWTLVRIVYAPILPRLILTCGATIGQPSNPWLEMTSRRLL